MRGKLAICAPNWLFWSSKSWRSSRLASIVLLSFSKLEATLSLVTWLAEFDEFRRPIGVGRGAGDRVVAGDDGLELIGAGSHLADGPEQDAVGLVDQHQVLGVVPLPVAGSLTVNADGSGTADLLRVLKGGTQRFSIDSYGVAYGVGAFYSDKVRMGNGTAIGGGVMSGTGSPDGVITGAAGDAWIRTDGTTGSWIYRCTGGTAWSAVL